MTDRITYLVQPAQGVNAHGWEVKREDAYRATETDIHGKEEAIEIAKEYAEDKWVDRGIPTEVKIRNLDGTWAADRGVTYGREPYPPRG